MRRGVWIVAGGIVVVTGVVAVGSAVHGRHVGAPEAQTAYAPTATIKELMQAIVDPSADDVWDAASTTVEKGGTREVVPRTDQDWAHVRYGALRLVEAANLLMMPGRHMARAGERSETPGIELEPQEMEALVTRDRQAWNARAKALQDASLDVLRVVDARNADQLSEVGGRLDTACENCHRQYWYPNEKIPAFPSDLGTKRPSAPGE